MERKEHGYGDGQARTSHIGPDGTSNTGQRTRIRDHRNRTPHSHEETLERDFPTREDNERDQQERMR